MQKKKREVMDTVTVEGSDQDTLMEHSVHPLAGVAKHKTTRVNRNIQVKPLSILIDNENSHSLVDDGIVREIKWEVRSTSPLPVTNANGGKLLSTRVCSLLNFRKCVIMSFSMWS